MAAIEFLFNRPRRAVLRLALPLAALLALAGCAQGGPAAEPTEQETTMQSAIPDPTSPEPTSSSPSSGTSSAAPTAGGAPSSGQPTSTGSSAAVPPPVAATASLTISIQQDASAEPAQYLLECINGGPGPASTLPGAEAACAALARLGTEFFTARPNKDIICTQQYGGPQTASITGELNGTSVLASFALTDGCEISRWNSAQDILGAPGAQ